MLRPRILAAALATSACAGLVVRGALPEGATPEGLGPADDGTPFALDPSGRRLAVVRGELLVVDLSGGRPVRVGGRPLALAWSPDGARLAASFAAGDDSTLQLVGPDGALLATAPVPGRLTSLAWRSATEVVGATVIVKTYSFGTSRDESLVRWGGSGAPAVEPIGAATMKRSTQEQYGEVLARAPALAIAAAGDLVAYAQLHDPPLFAPYVAIVVRHLDGTVAREVARMPIGAAGPAWDADGESVWFGGANVRRQGGWSDRTSAPLLTPGRTLAVSPRGTWVLADGRLFRGAEELVAFASDAEGAFTPTGLVLRSKGQLMRIAAFAERPAPPASARLLELRKLRAEGLVTPAEFDAQARGEAP